MKILHTYHISFRILYPNPKCLETPEWSILRVSSRKNDGLFRRWESNVSIELYHYIVASRTVKRCLHAKYTDTTDGRSGVSGVSTRVEVARKYALALAIKVAKQYFASQRGSVSMVS